MSQQMQDKIDYIVTCVNEFSDVHGMDHVAGFDYLKKYAGVAFLDRNYAVEHAYSIEDAVADLAQVCHRNGGNSSCSTSFSGRTMSAEVNQLIEFATQDLVAEIVAREGLSLEAAMDKLYHSAFFRQLTNPSCGLYREGGEYLYHAMQGTL